MNEGGGEKLMTSFCSKLSALSNDIKTSHFYRLKNTGENLIKCQALVFDQDFAIFATCSKH